MLSTVPENPVQAVAIKTSHQRGGTGKKRKRKEKKTSSLQQCNAANYPHQLKSSVAAICISANRSEDQMSNYRKSGKRLYWLCQTVCTMVAENRFVALSVTEEITFPLCCVCVFMRSQQYSNSTATIYHWHSFIMFLIWFLYVFPSTPEGCPFNIALLITKPQLILLFSVWNGLCYTYIR